MNRSIGMCCEPSPGITLVGRYSKQSLVTPPNWASNPKFRKTVFLRGEGQRSGPNHLPAECDHTKFPCPNLGKHDLRHSNMYSMNCPRIRMYFSFLSSDGSAGHMRLVDVTADTSHASVQRISRVLDEMREGCGGMSAPW